MHSQNSETNWRHLRKSGRSAIRDGLSPDFAIALKHAHHDGFVAPSDGIQLGPLISLHVPYFSADERFINFGVNAVPAKLYH